MRQAVSSVVAFARIRHAARRGARAVRKRATGRYPGCYADTAGRAFFRPVRASGASLHILRHSAKLRCADAHFPLGIVSCRKYRKHGSHDASVEQAQVVFSFRHHPIQEQNVRLRKIGLMTPGDMGQAVAMQIKARGFPV